jgi:hypothetical protein
MARILLNAEEMKRAAWLAMLLASLLMCVNSCKREDQSMNDALRLTDVQLTADKERAASGDRDAAKRVWLHYQFGVFDYQEGQKWRKLYEQLTGPTPSQRPRL